MKNFEKLVGAPLDHSPLFVIAVWLVVLLMFMLAGCGGNGTGDPSGTHDATTLPVRCGPGCSR